MKYLAQVVTENTKTITKNDYINIITPDNFNKDDNKIKTLIVGKSLAEKIYGKDKIKFLNKNIDKNVSWTYSKYERRNDFEEGLSDFYEKTYNDVFKTFKYVYFNIFTAKLSTVKRFIKYIDNNTVKCIYINNGFGYIYDGNYTVLGFSIKDYEVYGVSEDKVIKRIKQNKHNFVFNNRYFITKDMISQIKDKKYLIPFLYSIEKDIF